MYECVVWHNFTWKYMCVCLLKKLTSFKQRRVLNEIQHRLPFSSLFFGGFAVIFFSFFISCSRTRLLWDFPKSNNKSWIVSFFWGFLLIHIAVLHIDVKVYACGSCVSELRFFSFDPVAKARGGWHTMYPCVAHFAKFIYVSSAVFLEYQCDQSRSEMFLMLLLLLLLFVVLSSVWP